MRPGRHSHLVAVVLFSSAVCCGDELSDSVSTPVDDAVEAGPVHFVIPPFNSSCGRVQPGYDPGNPAEDIPPNVDGEEYSILLDDFCSVEWVYEFTEEDGEYYRTDYAYVVDMGGPDQELMSMAREHLPAMWPNARDYAFYYGIRKKLEIESVPGYDPSDVVRVIETTVAVTKYASSCYGGGWPLGEEWVYYLFRSSDPNRVILLDEISIDEQPEPSLLFQGYIGAEDSGGASLNSSDAGGQAWFYQACDQRDADSPRPDGSTQPASYDDETSCRLVDDPRGEHARLSMGPGVCRDRAICRYFSATESRAKCSFDDARALPANPELIAPTWRSRYFELMEQVLAP